MQSDGLHPFLYSFFFALLLIYTIFVLSNQDFNQNKVSRYAYHQTNYRKHQRGDPRTGKRSISKMQKKQ